MRNTLGDLNNHLFIQMERLNDDDLTDELLKKEMKRADGVLENWKAFKAEFPNIKARC